MIHRKVLKLRKLILEREGKQFIVNSDQPHCWDK
jgi:hypothetical protein